MFFRGRFASVLPGPRQWLTILFLLLIAVPVLTGEALVINEQTLMRMEQRFGAGARQRLMDWQNLVQNTDGDARTKLEKVNRFFNALTFIDDSLHWNTSDYWATPTEFLASRGGDCEDFAIAKYFTLIKLGIPEEQLTLTYVKALRLNQAHMVLTYYPTPGAVPLVLDNLNSAILPSSKRSDLLPVYSLNGSGLWLAKQRGKGKMIGSSGRLQRWREMLDRLTEETKQDKETPP
jgi:predicted transglutaminase-like cysteine proteinase